MNVPLAIFEEAGANDTCKIYVSNIGDSANFILGGMFFEEFFGVG